MSNKKKNTKKDSSKKIKKKVKSGSEKPSFEELLNIEKDKNIRLFANFMEFKSEQACRENGKLNIEGKDYIVNDGDIMHFRFNV